MIEKLTHFDENGQAVMVDVTDKRETARTAVAKGKIRVSADTMRAIVEGTAKKGDVLGVARVAGIMAVKRTSELIPLCHPLPIGKCSVDFRVDEEALTVEAVCTAKLTGQTGVEMEALTVEEVYTAKLTGQTGVEMEALTVEAVYTAKLTGQTGVEMEVLTGVSVALLTIYDMCKAVDKRMEITGIHLAKKTGGKSGTFVNDPEFAASPKGDGAHA